MRDYSPMASINLYKGNSLWVSHISAYFVGTGIDDLCSGLSFQEFFIVNGLEGTVSPSRTEGRFTLKTDYISL